jgi:hypothetical protein
MGSNPIMTTTIYTMKECHLVGNGPSRQKFADYTKSFNDSDIEAYGFNLSDQALPLRAVFVSDAAPLKTIRDRRIKFKFPIIPTPERITFVDSLGLKIHAIAHRNLVPPDSTGHIALEYFVHRKEHDVIHLWGFDSIFSDRIVSDSKNTVIGSCQVQRWLPHWKKEFRKILSAAKWNGIKVEIHTA